MNRLLGGLVLMAITSAASPPHAARQESASRTLLKLEDDWAAGLVKRDGALFRRLLAPGFVYTEDDQLSTRDDVLKSIISGSDTVEAAHNEEMRVHEFGATTAVVTGWLIVKGRGATSRFEHRYRFTDTWVRQNGRWQIVAAQDYLKR